MAPDYAVFLAPDYAVFLRTASQHPDSNKRLV